VPTKTTTRSKEERRARLDEATKIITESGLYTSVNQALRAVDLDRNTYTLSVGGGLGDNPRVKTIEKLRALGVLGIATRK